MRLERAAHTDLAMRRIAPRASHELQTSFRRFFAIPRFSAHRDDALGARGLDSPDNDRQSSEGALLATIGKARGAEIYSDLPTASASGLSAFIKSAKRDGFSCCGPSESALSGRGCTSISNPSAPAAIAATAIGATNLYMPVPSLASTSTSRVIHSFRTATPSQS